MSAKVRFATPFMIRADRSIVRADRSGLVHEMPIDDRDGNAPRSRSSLARLVLLALLWGSGFLGIKLALRGFTPVQIVLVRLALGALVLAPLALARGHAPTDRPSDLGTSVRRRARSQRHPVHPVRRG